VVEKEDAVIAERWGTRKEIVSWMETHWPHLPTKFVPMVYSPTRRHLKRRNEGPVRSRKQSRVRKKGKSGR